MNITKDQAFKIADTVEYLAMYINDEITLAATKGANRI